MDIVIRFLPNFLSALLITLRLALTSGLIALGIGIIVAILSRLKNNLVSIVLGFYINLMRSTPLLVQLYFIYFGLSVMNIQVSAFASATIALSLNSGAYMSEIIRGGLGSIDEGQYLAAYSMGMSKFTCMRIIILPQVFKRILSPLVTQISYLIKDTSLAAVLTITELTYEYRNAAAVTYRPVESLIIPMIFYFLLYFLFKGLSNLLGRNRVRRAK